MRGLVAALQAARTLRVAAGVTAALPVAACSTKAPPGDRAAQPPTQRAASHAPDPEPPPPLPLPSLLQGLALTVYGVGLMGTQPPRGWLARMLDEAAARRFQGLSPQSMALLVFGACGLLKATPPPGWLPAFHAALESMPQVGDWCVGGGEVD